MARTTRSQTKAAEGKLDSPSSRKRPSDANDTFPAKRQAATPKNPVAPEKAAAPKKGDVPRKTEKELMALRDGHVPDLNPDVLPRDEVAYWLLKSEPVPRFEDGYEIKFSIDDLAAKDTPEGWDGIRSYPARNNLRQMKKGDLGFFYHSNCKEPGVVGIVTIAKEWSPDWNACINDNPYYNANAPHDGSRWSLVHVKLVHKFPRIVPLRILRDHQNDGPLTHMQLLKQGRLSVSKVTKDEWDEILRLAEDLARDEWTKSIADSKLLPNYSA